MVESDFENNFGKVFRTNHVIFQVFFKYGHRFKSLNGLRHELAMKNVFSMQKNDVLNQRQGRASRMVPIAIIIPKPKNVLQFDYRVFQLISILHHFGEPLENRFFYVLCIGTM